MIRRIIWLLLATAGLGAPGSAQAPQPPDTVLLSQWIMEFRHYDCPAVDPAIEGGSPERPLELTFFSEAWANALYSDDPDTLGSGKPYKFECRWIRLSGFMQWGDPFYGGALYDTALASYQTDNVFYFIENFDAGSPPRGDLARRKLTIVARFYDLCAAGERALEAEKAAYASRPEELLLWRLSWPCHEVPAMMLSDARVETIHDAEPQYILGEGNRALMNSLAIATPEQHKEIEPLVRAWAASVEKGLDPFIDEYLALRPKFDAEGRQEARESIASPDSYESHLLRQSRFRQTDLQKAPVQVFRPTDSDDAFDAAVGCICLEASCTDRWPLTAADADNFLGAAACVALDRWGDSPGWRW